MIHIDCDRPAFYENNMVIRFTKPVYCPDCNLSIGMWRYGYRKRHIRNFEAKKFEIYLPRYKCQECKKVFWTIPSWLISYKQYDRETITKIQNGVKDGCGASYLSIYLWKRIVL